MIPSNKDIFFRRAIPYIDLINPESFKGCSKENRAEVHSIYSDKVDKYTVLEYFEAKKSAGAVKLECGIKLRFLSTGAVMIEDKEYHLKSIDELIQALKNEGEYLVWNSKLYAKLLEPFYVSFSFYVAGGGKFLWQYDLDDLNVDSEALKKANGLDWDSLTVPSPIEDSTPEESVKKSLLTKSMKVLLVTAAAGVALHLILKNKRR